MSTQTDTYQSIPVTCTVCWSDGALHIKCSANMDWT